MLAGLVKSDSADRLRLYDTAGKETVIPRAEVKTLRADAISIMPEGYAKLGAEKIRDLLTFLSYAEPPTAEQAAQRELLRNWTPRQSSGNTEPNPRTRVEVEAVVGKDANPADPQKLRPLRVLLVAGKKDHGPLEHDYPQWQKDWVALLGKAPRVQVSTAFGPPDARQWESADLAVFYCWGPQYWEGGIYDHLDKLYARGGGLVVLHSAVIAEKEPEKLAERIGLSYRSMIKFRHGPMDLNIPQNAADHPVLRGFGKVHYVDESYWPHVGKDDGVKVKVLCTTPEEGQERPMVWTTERGAGKGRSFSTILGHYSWTFDDPLARVLILRGMAWAAGEQDVNRLVPLATEGVKFREDLVRSESKAEAGRK